MSDFSRMMELALAASVAKVEEALGVTQAEAETKKTQEAMGLLADAPKPGSSQPHPASAAPAPAPKK